jgi:hypothetical protein
MVALVATNQDPGTYNRIIEQLAEQLPGTAILRASLNEVLVLAHHRHVQAALDDAGEALDLNWDRHVEVVRWGEW